jgi:hypothetical protein
LSEKYHAAGMGAAGLPSYLNDIEYSWLVGAIPLPALRKTRYRAQGHAKYR